MFDFIGAMKQAKTSDAILSELALVMAEFGLTSFAISGIPLPGENIAPYVLLNGWPTEWYERYVSQHYVHIDPIIYQARTSDDVFVWSEVINKHSVTPRARKLMDEAADYKMFDGFTVPLHLAGGLQAIVTFGAEMIELPYESRGILQLVAIYAHNRLRSLSSNTKGNRQKTIAMVTAHERDVIYWCAEGKTTWEIGQILGRSQNTVQHQLHSAQRKFDCVNRSQMIAEAFRAGLIR
ncbi:helix-turn-helix transcriptional regulator [Agrobacterium sp. rho-13.3]|uniref:helix-turn-helix transcriptional regulator n=1 Tax=Agrobacterium sp. rho-13.3 TaxID=3072980 RepID=UPI002A0E12AA|nr:LuxR family transcriptional regulator [Agrobacterium sp. rho-13.3]MDX8306210.1 LuxR family transcriptional regulator [Agrobacterium sp. rho-13.3]MDX8307459.1 LuxR family transcriptional regulator [Agrobacterium sp. rho-13.3]